MSYFSAALLKGFHAPIRNKPPPGVLHSTGGGSDAPVREVPSAVFLPGRLPGSWSAQGMRGCPSALPLAAPLLPRQTCASHGTYSSSRISPIIPEVLLF